MLRGSTSLPTRAGFQTTIKVTGWGARPPHKRLPWSRTGSAGVVTLYRVAFTLSIGAEEVGTVPDGARRREECSGPAGLELHAPVRLTAPLPARITSLDFAG
jgi:hypothetical protein